MLKDFSGGRIEYFRERGFWEVDFDVFDLYGWKVLVCLVKCDDVMLIEYEFVWCWDELFVIKVKIIDICSCDYEYGI